VSTVRTGVSISFELSRDLAAAPADCWQLLTDVERAPEWLTIVDEAQPEGQPGEGRVIHARGGMLGIHTDTRQVVHLWEPERRYGWRGEDPFPLTVECTLDEIDVGTRFTVAAVAEPGRFVPVAKTVLRRAARSQLTRSADRFQRLVESG
jgi:uncharacterized protein YndB with AHSA1/START domain